MLVAEKRGESTWEKVSPAQKQQEMMAEQEKLKGVHRLTDERETYEATGDGTPVSVPALSAEASRPTPFMSLSWEHWQEIREHVTRCLERFVRAAEEHRSDKVLGIGMEMQEIVGCIYLEAYVMSADLGLKEPPR